jgi:hypothetical protein
MEHKRLITSEWYTVEHLSGSGGLSLYDQSCIEIVKYQIDESEKDAIEQGYSPTKWQIIRNRSNTVYTEDFNGQNRRFLFQSTTREAIGLYDNGTITFYDPDFHE